MTNRCTLFLWLSCVAFGSPVLAAPPVEWVTATYFGAGDASDVEGAAVAADGTIYIVGNCASPFQERNPDVPVTVFGHAMRDSRCGSGFIAHLSPDGKRILGCAQFGKGITLLTTVQTTKDSVYVGGYASDGLQDGTTIGIDFTKTSGADALLVTTGEAQGQQVKLGDSTLTFAFLTADGMKPAVTVKGDKALVGKQTVTLKDGNVCFGATTP